MPEKKAKRKATKSVMMKWGPERLYNALSELGISFYVCRNGSLSCDARKGIITGWIIEVLEAKREKLVKYIRELAKRNHALDLARRMIAETISCEPDEIKDDYTLEHDLGIDSITTRSLMLRINREPGLEDVYYPHIMECTTVRDLANLFYELTPQRFKPERIAIKAKCTS